MADNTDNRVVPSGELSLDDRALEQVVTEEATQAHPQQSAVNMPSEEFGKYTLNDRFIYFLENSVPSSDLVRIKGNDKPNKINKLENSAISEIVKIMGSDFFQFENFRIFSSMGATTSNILVGNLKLLGEIPFNCFYQGLLAFFGDKETTDYLLGTDFSDALGINDKTKPVNLENEELLKYFPDFSQFKNLNCGYMIPKDPYLLLLAVQPNYRRFLSACFDRAASENIMPFADEKTFVGDYNNCTLDYQSYHIYSITKILGECLFSMKTIVKTGKHFDVKNLKQYMDVIDDLKSKLGKLLPIDTL